LQRSGGAPARHAVAVIGAETTEIVLGQGVAVTLAVSSAHESGHHFEVPILDLERLSPEIAKPRIDVELEQLDPGRVALTGTSVRSVSDGPFLVSSPAY